MAQAELVEATFDDGKVESFTSIKRTTAAGHTFSPHVQVSFGYVD
jgi:hypothetical protein